MLIQINDFTRIVKDSVHGYDIQRVTKDKDTGKPKLRKDGQENWVFDTHHPKLEDALCKLIREHDSFLDDSLTTTYAIM